MRICVSILLPALVAVGLCGCCDGDRTDHYIDVALKLTYWDGCRWASLGRKRAETVSIDYDNIPSGALLLLRNRTKGRED